MFPRKDGNTTFPQHAVCPDYSSPDCTNPPFGTVHSYTEPYIEPHIYQLFNLQFFSHYTVQGPWTESTDASCIWNLLLLAISPISTKTLPFFTSNFVTYPIN